MTYDLLAFLVIALVALAGAAAIPARALAPFPKSLLLAAIALRVVGSVFRYEILERAYDGIGDASGYYDWGVRIATAFWAGDPVVWPDGWLGFHFLHRLSGPVIAVIGPTMRGEFLVFSLVSFAGLFLMARAVAAVTTDEQATRFAALLWLWPSLWYWPSSIGKESVMLLGLGLVVLGVAGRRRSDGLRWLPYLAGLGVCFLIRPHVATIVACAAVAASFVAWLWARRAKGVEVVAAGAVALLVGAATSIFLEVETVEGLQQVVERRAERTLMGGSRLEGLPAGASAVPQAVANVYLRPVIWEVQSPLALAAALEVCVLGALVLFRRRALPRSLRAAVEGRLIPFAILVLVVYSLMVGLFYGNEGLIARQRVLAMPFLFLLLSFDSRAVTRPRAHGPDR